MGWGIVGGVVSSFLAWLVAIRVLRPRILISPHISRVPPPNEYTAGHLYRIKIRNARRWRAAIDLEVTCVFSMSGVHDSRPDNIASYELPTDGVITPRLKPRASRIFWIKPHEVKMGDARLPADLATKRRNGDLRLEELLVLPGARVRFFVRSNDGFSYAPLLAEREYTAGSVGIAPFSKGGLALRSDPPVRWEAHEINAERRDGPSGMAGPQEAGDEEPS